MLSLSLELAESSVGRMSEVCESWSLEDLTSMEDEDMRKLLEFYAPGSVPSLSKLRSEEDEDENGLFHRFEGSFGWM